MKISSTEKRKMYIAGLLSAAMLVIGYFIIKSVFVTSYDVELGGLWQAERIVMEKTDDMSQDQIAVELVTKDMEEGPEADYRFLKENEPVLTDEGEKLLPELGAYQVELVIDDLTLFPEIEPVFEQGMIDIQKEGQQGVLKHMQIFKLSDGRLVLCFGFDEKPEVTLFESVKDAVRIQFSPAE